MSSPRCVVIVARLATAATADSRAVGTNRGRAGGERGDDDGGKRGCEDEETLIHGRVGGGVTFFVDKVLIFAEAETETSGLQGGGPAAQHPTGPYLICVDAPSARCHATQVAVFVSLTLGPVQRRWCCV